MNKVNLFLFLKEKRKKDLSLKQKIENSFYQLIDEKDLKYKNYLQITGCKNFIGLPDNFICNQEIHIFKCNNLINLCEGDNLKCKNYLRILSCPNFEILPKNLIVNTVVINDSNLIIEKIPKTIKVKNLYLDGKCIIKNSKWI